MADCASGQVVAAVGGPAGAVTAAGAGGLDAPVGHPDRWNGEIYGKHASTTTLREFKALVAKAYAEREQA